MIGDYVRHKRTKEVISIFEIDDDRNVINNEPDGYCSEKNIDIDDVEPIPLTPEILEKNGFNIEIAPYTPDWKRCILNPNFFLEDRLKGFYHFNGNNLAKIQYVHELQHALKLCGIKKILNYETNHRGLCDL